MVHSPGRCVNRLMRTSILVLSLTGFLSLESAAKGGSVGDFFKALGNSIAHPHQRPANRRSDENSSVNRSPKKRGERPGSSGQQKGSMPAATEEPEALASVTPTATATSTPLPPVVRVASAVTDTKELKRDIPYAVPVPNKLGFVMSPYAPNQGYVDVRPFPSGTKVRDPYTGKVFLTP